MIRDTRGEIEHNQSGHSYSSSHSSTNDYAIEEGLDFILSHFEEPIWPRTIFTYTLGRQLVVYNKQEALARFKQANFLDCRVNAYPHYNEYYAINRQAPNFIFIDLDMSLFKSERAFWLVVKKTCRNVQNILSVMPTILWTGNGVHLYIPIEGIILETESLFSEFDHPSQIFLRFAAHHFSNGKSDPNNNPSFGSCLVRIPGTHNFKCVQLNNSITGSSTEVKLIQKWDEQRPKFNPLLYHFNIWLTNKEIKKINEWQRQEKRRKKYNNNHLSSANVIPWIEKLLQTSVDDYRKTAISLILAPYLINVKKISYANAYNIIRDWLNKCNSSKRLDSNFEHRIKYALKNATNKAYVPLKLSTLKHKNTKLYNLILQDLQP